MSARALGATGPTGDLGSRVHRLDPRAKLLGLTGVTVVGVSCTAAEWPVLVACAALLAAVAVLAGVSAREIWHRGMVVVPLVVAAAVFVPLTHPEGARAGLAVLATVAAKAVIGTGAAVLLGATTSFADTLRALDALRAPRVLVLIGTLMHRYFFLLVDDLARMRTALRARAYAPRSLVSSGALGGMAGALLLRSHARGERVHLAMRARGWTGRMPAEAPLRAGGAELAVAGVLIGLVALRAAVAL